MAASARRNRAPGGQERKTAMPTGTVKWFNSTKGYGFIAPDDGGKDVFVHISAVERAGLKGLNDNQKVGFELQSGRDGRASASDLRIL
jgi:cold shock protein